METKRSTAVEETVVTPASSPTSCEDVCSRGEDSDGFVSLMDEDGIIGLLEALEIVGVEEYGANVESDLKVPSGPLTETQLDEAGYHRGGSLSHRRSPGEDAQTLPPSPGSVFPEETSSGVDGAARCSDWSCQPSRTIKRLCPVAASFKNTSSPTDRDSRNPTASTNAAAPHKSSKSHLNGCTPDFSKVKPRVNFPKVSYKPPKSRSRSKGASPSFRPPIGAESVKEDSRDIPIPGVPPATPDCAGGRGELGSPREATRLLTELEENYNKLWIKYAEAENTIDHLRLAAKVNLYSDGPKHGHVVQSVHNQEASKFMTLNFPQAQRAEMSSSSLPSEEHRTPQMTGEPSVTLYTQAGDLLQRLQTFEDLLKCQQLSPDEERKELSQLFEGLRSLESSYLLAKDEHKLLLKEEEPRPFDPERELEGLIFDCALYMDELKEHAEQIREDLLTREASPSPARSSSPSEGREDPTHPQKTHVPSLVYPREGEATTLSSVSDEGNWEEASSLYLRTVNCNLGPGGELNTLPEDHQDFGEIPQALALGQKNKALLPTASKTDMQPGGSEEDGPHQKVENQKVKESLQQRNLRPEDFAHPYNSAQLVNQANMLDPSSRREGFEMRTSHSSSLSSLGELAASGKRNSTLQAGSCRLPSQGGIVSPETDSGFNGTESCHPTPTEAPSPLHQGAIESFSVVQDRNPRNPHNGLVTSPDPRCCPAAELSTTTKFNTKQPRRIKPRKAQRRRRTHACAHQCWTQKSNSGTSDVESSSSTVSEDGQTGPCRESVTTLSPSSSRSSRPRHGACTKVRRSTEATDNSVSMQMLQAEVSRLHHRLERCLKERERLVSASETTVQESHHRPRTSTPRVRSRKVNTDVTAAVRKRPCCAPEQGHHPDVYHPQTQTSVSRCTQTVSAASDNRSSHPNTVLTKHRSVSVQAPETSDEPDAKDLSFHSSLHLSPCLRCSSRQQAGAEDSLPGNSKAASGSCRRHPCGSTDADCHRFAHANANTRHQAAETATCCAAAAPPPPPPPPLQFVCPLPLLFCSSLLRAPPSNKKDTKTGFRSQKESKSRRKRPPSADGQNFLDRSLNKAIRAAKRMESTSGRMSRSLRFGLHHQQLLLTPLMAQLSQRQASS